MKYYKYKKINDLTLSSINESYIWFSSIGALNDPFEGDFTFNDNVWRKTTPLIKDGTDSIFNQASKLFEMYRFTLNNALYVFSLSSNKSNVVMSSHYGDEHRGIIIEYDFPDDIGELSDDEVVLLGKDRYIREVEYVDKTILSEDFLNDGEKISNCILRKQKDWKYEGEFRMVIYNTAIRKLGFKLKLKRSFITNISFGINVSETLQNDTINKIIIPGIGFSRQYKLNGHYSTIHTPC